MHAVRYRGKKYRYVDTDETRYKLEQFNAEPEKPIITYMWVNKNDCEELKDNVNHPNHYTAGGIETFDYIKAKLSKDQLQGYLTGNIIKYMSRYQFKNGIEDVKKAQRYMNDLIQLLEGEQ